MADESMTSILKQLVVSVPIHQARLDAAYVAEFKGTIAAIESVRGTWLEQIARQVLPTRMIAQETTFELELATSQASDSGIRAFTINSAFSRRFPRRDWGGQRITIVVRHLPPQP